MASGGLAGEAATGRGIFIASERTPDAGPFCASPDRTAHREISSFALNDVLQGIQGPSQAVAHVLLGFLEGLHPGLGALQLEP